MAKEYIERKPLLKFIEDGLNNPDKSKAFGHDAIEIMTEVQYAPAADVVEVKHGRWIAVDSEIPCDEWDCSACGQRRTFLYEMDADDMKEYYQHCPNCGAKMDGDDNA